MARTGETAVDRIRTSALLGNGLSISYNEALTCGSLTDGLTDIFRDARGADAVTASLQALAGRLQPGGTEAENFEQLLGPIDTIASALNSLSEVVNASVDVVRAAGP